MSKAPVVDEMEIGYLAAADRIEFEIGLPEGYVLDVGCNNGTGMKALARRWPGAEIWGLEPDNACAESAQVKGFNVMHAGAEAIPCTDAAFDFIFSRHSLEHVADRAAAIREFLRVLKRGGRLYVQAPIEPDGSKNALHISPFRSHEELRAAFGLKCSTPAPGCDEKEQPQPRAAEPHTSPWRELYWGPQETVAELILEKR